MSPTTTATPVVVGVITLLGGGPGPHACQGTVTVRAGDHPVVTPAAGLRMRLRNL